MDSLEGILNAIKHSKEQGRIFSFSPDGYFGWLILYRNPRGVFFRIFSRMAFSRILIRNVPFADVSLYPMARTSQLISQDLPIPPWVSWKLHKVCILIDHLPEGNPLPLCESSDFPLGRHDLIFEKAPKSTIDKNS
jgi:hypothetical protein